MEGVKEWVCPCGKAYWTRRGQEQHARRRGCEPPPKPTPRPRKRRAIRTGPDFWVRLTDGCWGGVSRKDMRPWVAYPIGAPRP